jgi:hypothetical protein
MRKSSSTSLLKAHISLHTIPSVEDVDTMIDDRGSVPDGWRFSCTLEHFQIFGARPSVISTSRDGEPRHSR